MQDLQGLTQVKVILEMPSGALVYTSCHVPFPVLPYCLAGHARRAVSPKGHDNVSYVRVCKWIPKDTCSSSHFLSNHIGTYRRLYLYGSYITERLFTYDSCINEQLISQQLVSTDYFLLDNKQLYYSIYNSSEKYRNWII